MSWDKVERRHHDFEMLSECEKGWQRFDKHVEESAEYREKSVQHTQQIETLEQAKLDIMTDLKEIRTDIKGIKADMFGIKIWVLTGVLLGISAIGGGIIVFFTTFGGLQQKVDFIYQHSYGVQRAIGKQVEVPEK